jgi:hypothetical protein
MFGLLSLAAGAAWEGGQDHLTLVRWSSFSPRSNPWAGSSLGSHSSYDPKGGCISLGSTVFLRFRSSRCLFSAAYPPLGPLTLRWRHGTSKNSLQPGRPLPPSPQARPPPACSRTQPVDSLGCALIAARIQAARTGSQRGSTHPQGVEGCLPPKGTGRGGPSSREQAELVSAKLSEPFA